MATKIQKMGGVICSDCRKVVEDYQYYCPYCEEEFEDGPLIAANTIANLPQSGVKKYG